MIKDQLLEFETKSKKDISFWEGLLEKIDAIPIFIYCANWIYRILQKYLNYSGQFIQGEDLIFLSIIAIPLSFWWLYSRNLKFGWFLRSSFYLFITIIISRSLISGKNSDIVNVIVLGTLLISATCITVDSFRKFNLQRLKIDNIVLGFAIVVDIGIIFLIFHY